MEIIKPTKRKTIDHQFHIIHKLEQDNIHKSIHIQSETMMKLELIEEKTIHNIILNPKHLENVTYMKMILRKKKLIGYQKNMTMKFL
jgi:hypothetical protein